MFQNSADEWRTLTEHYRRLVDEELLELAAAFADLTPTAQQVLRDEMRLRKLGDPQWTGQQQYGAGLARMENPGGIAAALANPESEAAVEYTWKTPLCQCETQEQAWQIAEVLKRAGIESWIDKPDFYTPHPDMDEPGPRVLVAADQLDEARMMAARPIPPDIVEQSRFKLPEYEPPVCPRCGSADPVLEDVEPANAWKCEACGAEWTDAAPEVDEGAENGSKWD